MRYTQSQIRQLLDIPVETFRTWRDAVPALRRHRGHGPTFAPGDVIALAVLTEAVRLFGVRVGSIGVRLDELFATCNVMSWLALESCVVMIEAERVRVIPADDARRVATEQATLVVPCAPIVDRLRGSLLASEPVDRQGQLQFPPTRIAGAKL